MTSTELADKVLGCLAGAQVGSAMGVVVEGWEPEEIEEEYGWLDYLDSWGGFPPGMTEDGIERQKLQVLSIIDNNGPIDARDLAKTWLKYTNEDSFGNLAGTQDEIHYRLIEAGIPPSDSGYHDAHIGRVGPHRASHANGIVNACYPRLAAKYALDVARIYQPPKGRGIPWKEDSDSGRFAPYGGRHPPSYTIGLDWSAAICAGIAEAMRPSATVDSVVDEATSYVVDPVAHVIRQGVDMARAADTYEELRDEFYELYSGRSEYMVMHLSQANEIVPKGFALFAFYEGDVQATMEGAVNFGRDTDCLGAISSGLAGAYGGTDTLPQKWIDMVNDAAEQNPYTVTDLTIEEQADGLYEALLSHHESLNKGSNAIAEMT